MVCAFRKEVKGDKIQNVEPTQLMILDFNPDDNNLQGCVRRVCMRKMESLMDTPESNLKAFQLLHRALVWQMICWQV